MVTIPQEFKTKIAKYAERLGKKPEELEKDFLFFFEEVSKQTKTKSEKILWKQTLQRWLGTQRRDTGTVFSPAPTFTGIVMGDAGLKDFVEIMKRKAEFLYKNIETRQKAINEMVVSSDGMPLDKREKINYGRDDNPNLGQPFPDDEKSLYRAVFALGTRGTELGPQVDLIRININGDEAEEYENPPVGSVVQWRGNPKKKNPYGFIDLNAISDKPLTFTQTSLPQPDDLTEPLSNSVWGVYTIKDLSTIHGMYEKDKAVPILLYASVATIGEEVNEKTGNRTLWLDEPEPDFKMPGISAFIKGTVPLEFGLDSQVLFVGSIRTIGEGEDLRYVYEIWGYYAPPIYTLPP